MTKAAPKLMAGDTPWSLPEGAKVYVFDLETDGLLDEVTRVHSLVIRDYWTDELVASLGNVSELDEPEPLKALLDEADYLVAHNGYKFDYPVLEKLFGWKPRPGQILLDTLPLARLIYSYLDDIDSGLIRQNRLPGEHYGNHSLEAWGCRLGEWKGDYSDWAKGQGIDPWAQWCPEMQTYCEQDTRVNTALLRRLLSKPYSDRAVQLELRVAQIMAEMEFNGFPFDQERAQGLYAELAGMRHTAERAAKEAFGSWWDHDGSTKPARAYKRFVPEELAAEVNRGTKKNPDMIRGYYKEYDPEAPFTAITRTEFNPGSRQQIAKRLIELHGWKPGEFTETGQPKVDETTLKGLPWPEAQALARLFTITKTLGQLAEGQNAWLKLLKSDGCIHGSLNPNGAVTGRATHSKPNIGQVPSVEVKEHKQDDGSILKEVVWGEAGAWGADCRALFTAPPGRTLVGVDLSKLELLCLAHYLARHDGGQYCEVVLSGDPHVFMQKNAEVDTRSKGKTLNYCLIYGGGDWKLGHIADPMLSYGHKKARGRLIRGRIMKNFTGYKELAAGCSAACKRGYLFGLDGRRVHTRHEHAAVNTLLQSAGALISKRWIVEFDRMFSDMGMSHGKDWQLHAFVHDEVQASFAPEFAQQASEIMIEAAAAAGKWFNLRVPILAEAKTGRNWQETH